MHMNLYQGYIALEAHLREEAVVNHLAARGYNVISTSDTDTRRAFQMPRAQPAADLAAAVTRHRLILAEVKGSDLEHALTQLKVTAQYAHAFYPCIECKVFVRNQAPDPNTEAVNFQGGRFGYRGVRIFRAAFPGEWVLFEYLEGERTRAVEIGAQPVTVVFGPYV